MGERRSEGAHSRRFKTHLKAMWSRQTFAWVTLNILAWIMLNLYIWSTFDLEYGDWSAADANDLVPIIATYTLIGLGMGLSQWLVLRAAIPRSFLWILVTTAGAGLGGLVARLFLASTHLGSDLFVIMLSVAFLQALLFWPVSHRAFWWIPAKIGGLMLSPYAVPLLNSDDPLASIFGVGCVCGGVLSTSFILPGVPFAFITAYALSIILPPPPQQTSDA